MADTEDGFHDIPGFEDRLQINIKGEVRTKSRRVNSPAAGGSRVIKSIRPRVVLIKGYPSVQVRKNGKHSSVYLHRALAKLFIPNPEGKPCINHIDGNKANFDLSNLEWCTHQENMRHAFATGLAVPRELGAGEMSPAAKLNNAKVAEIKRRLARGEGTTGIARQYGVRAGTIDHIRAGRTWAHI